MVCVSSEEGMDKKIVCVHMFTWAYMQYKGIVCVCVLNKGMSLCVLVSEKNPFLWQLWCKEYVVCMRVYVCVCIHVISLVCRFFKSDTEKAWRWMCNREGERKTWEGEGERDEGESADTLFGQVPFLFSAGRLEAHLLNGSFFSSSRLVIIIIVTAKTQA